MFQAVFHPDLQVRGCDEDNGKWGEITRTVGWGTIESAKTSPDECKVSISNISSNMSDCD